MVVDDLDVMGVSAGPAEANTPLLVDADAMLPRPIAAELLEVVCGRNAKVEKAGGRVEQEKLAESDSQKLGRQPTDPLPLEETFGIPVAEATNHAHIITRRVTIGKDLPATARMIKTRVLAVRTPDQDGHRGSVRTRRAISLVPSSLAKET